MLGKALYEGILVEVAFASFFLGKVIALSRAARTWLKSPSFNLFQWLGKQSYLDDLQSLDSELYQGLVFLKHYDGKVDDLSLNFTVAVSQICHYA